MIETLLTFPAAPAPPCRACDGGESPPNDDDGWTSCLRCHGGHREEEVACAACDLWLSYARGEAVTSPEADEPVCLRCAGMLARFGWCGVEGCREVAERVCASCEGHRCAEHVQFSVSADEDFCALRPEAYRQGRTITYCDASKRGAA